MEHLFWHVTVCRKLVSLRIANVKSRGGVRNKCTVAADHSEKLSVSSVLVHSSRDCPEPVQGLSGSLEASGGKQKN